MPQTEIYIKLVVGFPNDQKVRALCRFGHPDAGLARDLYVAMVLHCKEYLTDGFVPAEQVGILAYPAPPDVCNQLANQLASVGLIKEVSNTEAPGWQVCAFLKRNRSREEVEALSQVRAESGREGGLKSRKPARPAGQRRSPAGGKQVANQGASKLPPIVQSTENTDASKEASDAAQQRRRASRIPADFTVTADMVAWARANAPHVDGKRETDKFINHWTAKSGKDATKLDWVLTWRNWMLNAEERAPHSNGRTSSHQQTLPAGVSPRDEHRYRG